MNQATEPTLEEIRQRCEEVQSTWSERERWNRTVGLDFEEHGTNGRTKYFATVSVPTAKFHPPR